jgi:hypothetical protein
LYCGSGSGEFETKQQELSDEAASWVPVSPMFILSQSESAREVPPLAGLEDIAAHLESGANPAPIKANAIPMMSARLTGSQSISFDLTVPCFHDNMLRFFVSSREFRHTSW